MEGKERAAQGVGGESSTIDRIGYEKEDGREGESGGR